LRTHEREKHDDLVLCIVFKHDLLFLGECLLKHFVWSASNLGVSIKKPDLFNEYFVRHECYLADFQACKLFAEGV